MSDPLGGIVGKQFKVGDLVHWKECPSALGDYRYGPVIAIHPGDTLGISFVRGRAHFRDCELLEPGTAEHTKALSFWKLYGYSGNS